MDAKHLHQVEATFRDYICKLILANFQLMIIGKHKVPANKYNKRKSLDRKFRYWNYFLNSLASIFTNNDDLNTFFMDFNSLSIILEQAPLSIDEKIMIISKIIVENRKITNRFNENDMIHLDDKAKNLINATEQFYNSFIEKADTLTIDDVKKSVDSLKLLGIQNNTLMAIEDYLAKCVVMNKSKKYVKSI